MMSTTENLICGESDLSDLYGICTGRSEVFNSSYPTSDHAASTALATSFMSAVVRARESRPSKFSSTFAPPILPDMVRTLPHHSLTPSSSTTA